MGADSPRNCAGDRHANPERGEQQAAGPSQPPPPPPPVPRTVLLRDAADPSSASAARPAKLHYLFDGEACPDVRKELLVMVEVAEDGTTAKCTSYSPAFQPVRCELSPQPPAADGRASLVLTGVFAESPSLEAPTAFGELVDVFGRRLKEIQSLLPAVVNYAATEAHAEQ